VSKVAAFVEKPDQATAERYVLEGYLWNSGNFAFKASTLLAEFEAFEPSRREAAARPCVALLELEAGLGRLDREPSPRPRRSRSTTR
jgi:mannose-1-phosphate guanylyltransferase